MEITRKSTTGHNAEMCRSSDPRLNGYIYITALAFGLQSIAEDLIQRRERVLHPVLNALIEFVYQFPLY